jgi:hypothetical protein
MLLNISIHSAETCSDIWMSTHLPIVSLHSLQPFTTSSRKVIFSLVARINHVGEKS